MKNKYIVSENIAVIEVYKKLENKYYYVLVDSEAIETLNKEANKVNVYVDSHTAYASCTLKNKTTKFLHRLIMETPKHLQVDHINRNGLDNRKKNLRNCTHRENQANRRTYKTVKHEPVSPGLHESLREFRISQGLKQKEMAEILGYSLPHYNKIERGTFKKSMPIEKIMFLGETFKVPWKDIIGG